MTKTSWSLTDLDFLGQMPRPTLGTNTFLLLIYWLGSLVKDRTATVKKPETLHGNHAVIVSD